MGQEGSEHREYLGQGSWCSLHGRTTSILPVQRDLGSRHQVVFLSFEFLVVSRPPSHASLV